MPAQGVHGQHHVRALAEQIQPGGLGVRQQRLPCLGGVALRHEAVEGAARDGDIEVGSVRARVCLAVADVEESVFLGGDTVAADMQGPDIALFVVGIALHDELQLPVRHAVDAEMHGFSFLHKDAQRVFEGVIARVLVELDLLRDVEIG